MTSARVGCFLVILRPSPLLRRVGFHNFTFEACSGFTRVTARMVACPPKVDVDPKASINRIAPANRPGCYRAEPTIAPADLASAGFLRLRGALRNE